MKDLFWEILYAIAVTALVAVIAGMVISLDIGDGSWKSGAIGVYEGTIQCEQAMDEWVCRKIEKGLE